MLGHNLSPIFGGSLNCAVARVTPRSPGLKIKTRIRIRIRRRRRSCRRILPFMDILGCVAWVFRFNGLFPVIL